MTAAIQLKQYIYSQTRLSLAILFLFSMHYNCSQWCTNTSVFPGSFRNPYKRQRLDVALLLW